MSEDTIRVDLFEQRIDVIKIERRKQNAGDNDALIDYMVRVEYDLGLGKTQTLDLYMDELPPGLQVGGTNLYMCIEARS